jgi:hypothetical protein
MSDDRFDAVTKAMARARSLRELVALTLRTRFGRAVHHISIPGSSARGASKACVADWPTWKLMQAARPALLNGATNVAISPGGCVRMMRETTAKETVLSVIFDGIAVQRIRYQHDNSQVISEEDYDLDGFVDARTTYPPHTAARPSIVRRELTPSGATSQVHTTTIGATVAHVEIRRPDSHGVLTLFSKYDVELDQFAWSSGFGVADGGDEEASMATRARRTTPQPCTTAEQHLIAAMVDSMFEDATSCTHRYRDAALVSLLAQVAARSLRVRCFPTDEPTNAGFTPAAMVPPDSWATWGNPLKIYLFPAFFRGRGEEMKANLFHEVLHTRLEWAHHLDEEQFGRRSEVDPVYACQSLCFGLGPNGVTPPTRCSCASCLQTTKCDVRCQTGMDGQPLSDCDAMLSVQCPCPLGKNAFKRFDNCSDCLTECPSGLACFGYASCSVIRQVGCPGEPLPTCP